MASEITWETFGGSPEGRVTFGLWLALTAPSDAQAQEAAKLAEYLVADGGLTAAQVERCKAEALEYAVEVWAQEGVLVGED